MLYWSPQRLEEIMKRTRKTDAEKVIKRITDYSFTFLIWTKPPKCNIFPTWWKQRYSYGYLPFYVFIPYNEQIKWKVKKKDHAHWDVSPQFCELKKTPYSYIYCLIETCVVVHATEWEHEAYPQPPLRRSDQASQPSQGLHDELSQRGGHPSHSGLQGAQVYPHPHRFGGDTGPSKGRWGPKNNQRYASRNICNMM